MDSVLSTVANTTGLNVMSSYKIGSFRGIKLSSTSYRLINILTSLADIAYIEADQKVTTSALTTQANATWGLARISSRVLGTTSYTYDDSAGQGTFAYCIDTGIATDHPDFEGRAEFGASFVDGEGEGDGNGHGTHTAGTVGSKTWGVAKKTRLVAVKVLGADGSGSTSSVIEGMQWTLQDATVKGRIGKSVANLSLGGPKYLGLTGQASNDAAAAMVAGGVFLSVAAGNDNLPVSGLSPASERTVCTVGATDNEDARAQFSNWGDLIDVFAPGVGIKSTWNDLGTNTISGTSMAAPHITGLAAYLLSLEGAIDPDTLCGRIQTLATTKVVSSALSKNDLLAYNGIVA
ncbi:hypothetical protein NPX13_g9192 [Xylaria arbuscula]|uniref:Peptidase S8/S53 domain-containing protein n=1 Tax=Xylaria arbuscula TaxID=114810 RepID=A0A9W8N6U9_9PEZI|nr:hypothetical protein NPX13_g9192 [Xylaria arbuscula]